MDEEVDEVNVPTATKVMVVTDVVTDVVADLAVDVFTAAPELVDAMTVRAATEEEVRFHLVVLNPARAEVHVWHPERHDLAFEAECVLLETLPRLWDALGRERVTGSVSVRHEPMDAIEEAWAVAPVDEIWLHVRERLMARRLHQDLPHRLAHLGVPVRVVHHASPT
ncbi:MAG: hypothetical protein JWR42_2412 [Marmoricola sp.]|nr:hypothetical protein [Marmoricola sp.]